VHSAASGRRAVGPPSRQPRPAFAALAFFWRQVGHVAEAVTHDAIDEQRGVDQVGQLSDDRRGRIISGSR
jgi:hypothetical protein